ncbi:MAG: hypothetical protein M1814_005969 [Vezdaea aestivalis]|nr:MAG: hypothetical protein M1814_005969 [Vezdaea aestivalis]
MSRTPDRGGQRYRSRSYSRSPSRGRSPSPPKSTKIVVEKLTKNVNEEHLKEIFAVYGQIREVDMPINRQFNTNRGTAYISYNTTTEAETAISHMHEAQLDGAVIKVSIIALSHEAPLREAEGLDIVDPLHQWQLAAAGTDHHHGGSGVRRMVGKDLGTGETSIRIGRDRIRDQGVLCLRDGAIRGLSRRDLGRLDRGGGRAGGRVPRVVTGGGEARPTAAIALIVAAGVGVGGHEEDDEGWYIFAILH